MCEITEEWMKERNRFTEDSAGLKRSPKDKSTDEWNDVVITLSCTVQL